MRVEDELLALADDWFTPVFLRNATAFGFSPRLRADIVLNNLVGHAYLAGQVRVLSDGTPWRPLVHAGDIAAAFAAVLAAPREAVHARAFNVGTERNNVTVAEIAAEVLAAVPGSELLITGESGGDPRSYRVDFSRIRAALPDFRARWSVQAGAVELVEAYRLHGLTKHDFERRFTRLAWLSDHRASGGLDGSLRPPGRPPMTDAGAEMHALVKRLYPLCRSITGDGVRHTLDIIARDVPLECTRCRRGPQVLDWNVPREWNIRDAYIKDSRASGWSTSPIQPARGGLQRAGVGHA